MVAGNEDAVLELGLPSGETVDDGEWVLAIFELGAERRATSAAARAAVAPDGSRLVFEPRDWQRLEAFAQTEAKRPAAVSSAAPPRRRATLPRIPAPPPSAASPSSRAR